MALLKIKVLGKVYITWGSTRLSYIRNMNALQNSSVSFSNASGQAFTAGQILFTLGSTGSTGFLQVRSKNNVTLTGNGVFEIEVEHFPSSTATDYVQNYTIDSSATSITFTYNSKPEISDIVVETPNNTTYVFASTDFTTHYSDFDSDAIAEIQISGDVTGYKYDDIDYIAGVWIPISHVNAGRLTYVPLGQTTAYEKNNTWKAKDSQGNISIN